jgi:hypothetical protein
MSKPKAFLTRRRNMEDEGRTFEQTLEEEYFSSQIQSSVVYLICQKTVSVCKE